MHLSVRLVRRNRPLTHFLTRTSFPYRLVISAVMVGCLLLSPQMSSADDGNEESAPIVIAIVPRSSPLSSPRKVQERPGQLNRAKTARASLGVDNFVPTLEFNPGLHNGRSILKSLCVLRC